MKIRSIRTRRTRSRRTTFVALGDPFRVQMGKVVKSLSLVKIFSTASLIIAVKFEVKRYVALAVT